MSIFGKSRDGGGFSSRKFWKLKDGKQTFRILPALGDNAEDGVWSKYYSVHFGYRNSQGRMIPFESPEVKDSKTKMVTVPDAAKHRIDLLNGELAKAKSQNDGPRIEKLNKLLQTYNLDKNHYLNAIDSQGNIGVLKLRHKAKLVLDNLIKNLAKEGVDPRDPVNGRLIVFERTGTSNETSFSVAIAQEELDVPGVGKVKRDIVSSISPEMEKRMGELDKNGKFKYREAANLLTLFKKPSASDVERIVKEGPKALDEIFPSKEPVRASGVSAAGSESSDSDTSYDNEYEVETTTSVGSVQSSGPTTVTVVGSTVGTGSGLQAVTSTVSSVAGPSTTQTISTPLPPKVNAAPVATPVAKSTAEILSEQSDEDFFKSLGLNT